MPDEEELTLREHAARQIFTQADWDREKAAGRLTAQHVAERLYRMAVYVFGNPDADAAAAYDEDGFFVSLTAGSVAIVDGVKLWICTQDHDPPHVHIKLPGKKDRLEDIKINLVTREVEGQLPRGVRSKKLQKMQALVDEHHDDLCTTWTSFHGSEVARK